MLTFTYFSNLSYFLQQGTGEEILRCAVDDKTLLQKVIMVTATERKETTGAAKSTERFCNLQSNCGTRPTSYSMDTVGFALDIKAT